METMSRLALMAVLSRAGRGTAEEKVTWNGSAGYLPIITVEDYDAAETGGRPRRRRARTPSGQGKWSPGEALFAAVLALQCCAVAGVEACIIWKGSGSSDFDVWNWLVFHPVPASTCWGCD